jgi:Zn-dependent protease
MTSAQAFEAMEETSSSLLKEPDSRPHDCVFLFRLFTFDIFLAPRDALKDVSLNVIYLLGPIVLFPGQGTRITWQSVLGWGAILSVSILLHELGHGIAARMMGVPVRHIVITLTGGAHTAMGRDSRRASEELLSHAAGPAANFVIAALFGWLWRESPSAFGGNAEFWFASIAAINAWLAIYNCVPVFPLDGASATRAMIWAVSGDRRLATSFVSLAGRLATLSGGAYAAYWCLKNGYMVPGFLSIRLALAGLQGTTADDGQHQWLNLSGLRVVDLMQTPSRCSPDADVRVIIERRLRQQHGNDLVAARRARGPVVVFSPGGEVLGMILASHLSEISRWGSAGVVTATAAMTAREQLVTVGLDTDLATAAIYMEERQVDALLVVDGNEPCGVITIEEISLVAASSGNAA